MLGYVSVEHWNPTRRVFPLASLSPTVGTQAIIMMRSESYVEGHPEADLSFIRMLEVRGGGLSDHVNTQHGANLKMKQLSRWNHSRKSSNLKTNAMIMMTK